MSTRSRHFKSWRRWLKRQNDRWITAGRRVPLLAEVRWIDPGSPRRQRREARATLASIRQEQARRNGTAGQEPAFGREACHE